MNPITYRLLRVIFGRHLRGYTDQGLLEERASTLLRKALWLHRPGCEAEIALASTLLDAVNAEVGRREDLVKRLRERAKRRAA